MYQSLSGSQSLKFWRFQGSSLLTSATTGPKAGGTCKVEKQTQGHTVAWKKTEQTTSLQLYPVLLQAEQTADCLCHKNQVVLMLSRPQHPASAAGVSVLPWMAQMWSAGWSNAVQTQEFAASLAAPVTAKASPMGLTWTSGVPAPSTSIPQFQTGTAGICHLHPPMGHPRPSQHQLPRLPCALVPSEEAGTWFLVRMVHCVKDFSEEISKTVKDWLK